MIEERQRQTSIAFKTNYINRPRLIYQYSYMALRLSGQIFIFGVVFVVSQVGKSPLAMERQKKLLKIQIFTKKLGAMLEYLCIVCG